jgi:tRNA dimethylallyltransferase
LKSATTKFLVVVIGPTAVGKTALSIKLAQAFKTEIISADSRQFFKEMQIGTACPTDLELTAAKHHFIGHLSIHEKYTAGKFEREALEKITQLHENHQVVIMTGGSGLYVQAVTHGLDNPPASPEIRIQLIREFEENGLEFLQEKLKNLDPETHNSIDLNNHQRLIRALEVCLVSGKPYSYFLNHSAKERPFKTILIGLNLPREQLYQRINDRVDAMVKLGLLEEAKTLYPQKHLNALQTVGYKELFLAFDGQMSEEEAIEKIKQNTRNFAKRQLTWFKKYAAATYFEPNNWNEIYEYIHQEINK